MVVLVVVLVMVVVAVEQVWVVRETFLIDTRAAAQVLSARARAFSSTFCCDTLKAMA